ncbi:hypothetical protein HS088_TW15G00037 [Tripterygium wilfordii]|uniref:Protein DETOXIFICATION n=1 Tax=Tripterygium wilfordii TaxID=458696 RepID=A0A7J7CKF2_TRIWF|nr:hypothetical protein HS088_TW15G00037 [Tripterygium wilfordii]
MGIREENNLSWKSSFLRLIKEDEIQFNKLEMNCQKGSKRELFFEELKKQLWLAGPIVTVSVLQYLAQLISIMFVGHLGELSLAGASLATSFITVAGYSLLLGMSSALDTFCGQAYGAKQYHMMGIHLQRAIVVLLLVTIPIAFVVANTSSILIALGQDVEISNEAGQYAQFMIPSFSALALIQCFVKFLQMQNIVFPMLIFSGISTLFHILLCWILVIKTGFGNKGASMATSISYWINAVLLILYVKFSSSCAKTWTGFSKEALHGTYSFLRLAIPSAVMVCLEMWSYDMVVLISGLLPNPKLQTSVLSTWLVQTSIITTICTRVSNELGAGRANAARLAAYVVLAMAISEGILCVIVFMLLRNIWGYTYSNEIEVVEYVARMIPFLSMSIFLDGLQCVLSGVARGCGWQKIGAYINLGSYYLVGIPSAILFGFGFNLGGKGLWLGIICAIVVQGVALFIVTIRTNWEQEARKATDTVHGEATVDMVP